jgi:hypothetical protein
MQPRERTTTEEKGQRAAKESYWRTFFSRFTSPEQSYAAAVRQDTTPVATGTADRWEKRPTPRAAVFVTTEISENKSFSTVSQFV